MKLLIASDIHGSAFYCKRLIEAFENIKKDNNRSLLIISHQERIMNIADYIAVVSGGKVVKMGTREEIFPTLIDKTAATRCSLRTN